VGGTQELVGGGVTAVGAKVAGAVVGADVGDSVTVGARVGDAVGDAVGATVGLTVGARVGDAVGATVGARVGDAVGATVGAGVSQKQPKERVNCTGFSTPTCFTSTTSCPEMANPACAVSCATMMAFPKLGGFGDCAGSDGTTLGGGGTVLPGS
jgi:hypothetical protein